MDNNYRCLVTFSRIFAGIYSSIRILIGFAAIVLGIAFMANEELQQSVLNYLELSEMREFVVYIGPIFIFAGLIAMFFAIISLIGVIKRNKIFLLISAFLEGISVLLSFRSLLTTNFKTGFEFIPNVIMFTSLVILIKFHDMIQHTNNRTQSKYDHDNSRVNV
jgi:hypothetical protein